MWRETIKLRLAWSLLFILWGKFSAMVNHYAVEHDLQKYSRALCASVPLLYWKIMGLYPIKNCIKSLKYYMHFTGISLIRLFCMCRCWQHTEKGCFDWLLPFKSSSGGVRIFLGIQKVHAFAFAFLFLFLKWCFSWKSWIWEESLMGAIILNKKTK